MTLPIPDPAFRWSAEPWGSALRCVPLEAIAQHAFTTKQLQLRPAPGSGPDAHALAWTQATASVGAGLGQLMRVKQVHGTTVRVLRRGEVSPRDVADRPQADALISDEPGLALAVQVADCAPILLADRKTGAAAVHAGWRGTCAGVARAAVAAMTTELGTRPEDLTAAIGPSIGACCYEVGEDVLDAFKIVGFSDEEVGRWFARTEAGSLRLDLWAATRDQLRAAGVRDNHIYISRLCTQTHGTLFNSFRAEGEQAGRMAGLIVVP